jgi:hypothetical protein
MDRITASILEALSKDAGIEQKNEDKRPWLNKTKSSPNVPGG